MVTLTDIQSGYGLVTTINANWRKIESAFDDKLTRVGTAGSQMEANLDMNAKRITNLANATNSSDAVTLAQLLGEADLEVTQVPMTQANVGTTIYPLTTAEEEAGIVEYNPSGPAVGDIYRPWIEPGNILRYGADPTGTMDSTVAIQAAIDAAIHTYNLAEPTRQNSKVVIPDGYFVCNAPLWCHEHNTEHPLPNARWYQKRGDIKIVGTHSPYRATIEGAQFKGSRVHFTSTTGDGLIMSNPERVLGESQHQVRNVIVESLAISGDTSGSVVQMREMGKGGMKDCTIYSTGPGIAWNVDGSYLVHNTNVLTYGAGAGGIGIQNAATDVGGGITFRDCEIGGFDICLDLGTAFDPQRNIDGAFIGAFNWLGGQIATSRTTGIRCRHGIRAAHFQNTWFEHMARDAVPTPYEVDGGFMLISDSAFKDPKGVTHHNRYMAGLQFTDCQVSPGITGAGISAIIAGADSVIDGEATYGSVRFTRCAIGNIVEDGSFIGKWDNEFDGDVWFDQCSYVSGGIGHLVKILGTDEAQYGRVLFENMQHYSPADNRWLVNNTYDTRKYYMSKSSTERADLVGLSGTLSYAKSREVPDLVSNLNSGGSLTIELPDNTRGIKDFDFTIGFRGGMTDTQHATLILDGGTRDVLSTEHATTAQSQTFLVSKYSQYHVRYDGYSNKYLVSLLTTKRLNTFETTVTASGTYTPSSVLKRELVYLNAHVQAAPVSITLADGVVAGQEITFVLETVSATHLLTITPDSFAFLAQTAITFPNGTTAAGDSITLWWSQTDSTWYVKARTPTVLFI